MSDIESIKAGLARLKAEAERDPEWQRRLARVDAETRRLKAECIDAKPAPMQPKKSSKVVPIREVEI